MIKILALFEVTVLFIVGLLSFVFAQEQLTITTYYPSPFGSYRELRTNRMAVGPTVVMPATDGELSWGVGGLLSSDQGGSIELGGSAGTPYIDFDNNFRIVLNANNDLGIEGGRTTFANDDGTPAIIRTGEVWFCTQY